MDAFRPIRLPRFELGILQDTSASSSLQTGTYARAQACMDDTSWKKGSDTCAHYAIDGYDCEDIGDNGVPAKDACKVSCNTCPQDIDLSHSQQGHVYDRLPSSIKPMDESGSIREAEWKMGEIDPMVRAPEHNEMTMELMIKLDALTQRIQGFEKVIDLSTDLVERGITSSIPTQSNTTPETPAATSTTSAASATSATAPTSTISGTDETVVVGMTMFTVSYTGKGEADGNDMEDDAYDELINNIGEDGSQGDLDTLLAAIKENIAAQYPGITADQITIISIDKGSLKLTMMIPNTVSNTDIASLTTRANKDVLHTIQDESFIFSPTVDVQSIQSITPDPLVSTLPDSAPMYKLQDNPGKMLGIYILISLVALLMSYFNGIGRVWKFKGVMFLLLPLLYVFMTMFGGDNTGVRKNIMWVFAIIMTVVIYYIMRSIKLKSGAYSTFYTQASTIKIVGMSTLTTLLWANITSITGLLGI
jgi:hypothetical protein